MDNIETLAPGGYYEVRLGPKNRSYVVRQRCMKTLRTMVEVVSEHEGEMLTRVWNGCETKATLRCKAGHVWQTTARPVMYQGTWCPECAIEAQRLGIEEAHRIAAERGGRSLCSVYTNAHTVMQWMCADGHTFLETVNEIKEKGAWCRLCQPNASRCRALGKLSFNQALQMAEKAGGVHLGDTDRLTHGTSWRCINGHTWVESARNMIVRGWFCRKCHGRKAKTLRETQETAKLRGGRCLSTAYENNYTPMEWECEFGHQWKAPWKNVGANNSWCRVCADTERRSDPNASSAGAMLSRKPRTENV